MSSENQVWEPYIVGGVMHPKVYIQAEKPSGKVRAKILPGGRTIPHIHSGSEIIEVTRGTISVIVDGMQKNLNCGEQYAIPSGSTHGVMNATEDVAEVLAHFNPTFEDQTTTFPPKLK